MLSGTVLLSAFVTEKARERYCKCAEALDKAAENVYEITPEIAGNLSDTKTSQGIFCIAAMRRDNLEISELDPCKPYIILENIQDPGNLGTILRTAEAMGISGVMLSSGCTDIYSPKAVRSSMGAVFRIAFADNLDIIKTIALLNEKGHNVFAATARGGEDILSAGLRNGAAVVIGNEGSGLTRECINGCRRKLTVNMKGRAESLNAATAAAVIIWEMTK